MGLALSRRLVELHGGTIEARSEGTGKGSEFIVRLPELRDVATKTVVQRNFTATEPPTRLRLLLVDDNVDSARTLAMLLDLSGHEAHVVHNGPSALSAISEHPVDCVLLDIGMPDMNGYGLLSACAVNAASRASSSR